jgi:hypothetical protein
MQLCTKMSAVVANLLSDVAGSDVMVQVLLASILFVVVHCAGMVHRLNGYESWLTDADPTTTRS